MLSENWDAFLSWRDRSLPSTGGLPMAWEKLEFVPATE